jgi:RNA polymerase sigma factor (TIGR02999 family)
MSVGRCFCPMTDLPALFAAVRRGDRDAKGRLYQALYHELQRLARARIRRSSDMTLLNTTVLVHECYLRLVQGQTLQLTDQAQFLSYAARVMRSIVVDFARARAAQRRGGAEGTLTLTNDVADSVGGTTDPQIVRLNEALDELAGIDARLVQIVEMRFFVGLTIKQIAGALAVSERTVGREWEKARVFLRSVLAD